MTVAGNWELWLQPSTVWRNAEQPWNWQVDGAPSSAWDAGGRPAAITSEARTQRPWASSVGRNRPIRARREAGFRNASDRAKFHEYIPHWPGGRPVWPEVSLVEWLLAMPKPIGILAANDERAAQTIDARREARLAIPEQVSILGVDNDEIVRSHAGHPVVHRVARHKVGYEAAALLDGLIKGGQPARAPFHRSA